jgi:hypothetical protein
MDNNFFIFVPNIILLVLFIIFLWQRHSLKNIDWVNLIAITLGIALLAIVIALIVKGQPAGTGPLKILLIVVPTVLFVLFLLFLTRIFTVEKVKSKLHFDERLSTINAKSARNALVAVYLSSVVNIIIYSSINQVLFFVILAVSLVVYLASMIIYYYRSF